MRVLLLSAYSAKSHQVWCNCLKTMFPEHQWTELSLPGRYFNWRIRSNALTWALQQADVLQAQYDTIVATSMVDCATLRGLVPGLATLPWVVYFHENQFAYPVDKQHDHTEPKMVSLYNALCADRVIFNTTYNKQSFVDGLARFLKKMPDKVPANVIEKITAKAQVIPVPIDFNTSNQPSTQSNETPVLLWNHRWEYDKGPQQLYRLLCELRCRSFKFKLNLIGQSFRNIPEAILKIQQAFSEDILNNGYIESQEDYTTILSTSDFVLSTSLHDFQGLAVLEAVSAGCIPVVPARLAYPEIFPLPFCYRSYLEHGKTFSKDEASAMADKIIELDKLKKENKLELPDLSEFSTARLKAIYTQVLFTG